MKNKILKFITFSVICVGLVACSNSSENVIGHEIHNDVKYNQVNGQLVCYGASGESESRSSSGTIYHNCHWDCSNYKGASDIYVSLDFINRGNGWVLYYEYTSGGLCTEKKY